MPAWDAIIPFIVGGTALSGITFGSLFNGTSPDVSCTDRRNNGGFGREPLFVSRNGLEDGGSKILCAGCLKSAPFS